MANSDADFTLTVAATSTDTGGATAQSQVTLPVTVIAAADTPMLNIASTSISGLQGVNIPLGITLAGWIVMTLLAYLATSAPLFWVAAVIAGLCMGSSQSAGRALVGVFAPGRHLAEFFGLWTFAVRLAAIIGPLTYGAVTWWTAGNHRLAILSTAAFFVVGLVLLRPVDVARGQAAARAG